MECPDQIYLPDVSCDDCKSFEQRITDVENMVDLAEQELTKLETMFDIITDVQTRLNSAVEFINNLNDYTIDYVESEYETTTVTHVIKGEDNNG